jgi:tetratricopeptide (TPR) repeat protein
VDAVDALKVALDLDPNHLQAHVALGDAYLKQGDLGEASAEYNRALKLRSEYPQALDGIARTYEAQAEDDRAISFYNRAIASNKGYAEAYTHLGDLYLRIGRLEEAVLRARPQSSRSGPQPARAPERGGRDDPQGDRDRAGVGRAPRHTRPDPAGSRTPGGSGGLVSRSDRPRSRPAFRAERDEGARLEAAIAEARATPGEMRALASIYAGRRLWVRAAELEAESRPEGAERERLAYYAFRAGRFRASHDLYSDLARSGGRADLEVNAGVALSQLGENVGAAAAFRRALSVDPSSGRASLYLGNALLRLGRKDEAVASYKAFLEGESGGELAERVRRILTEIAPEALPAPAATDAVREQTS